MINWEESEKMKKKAGILLAILGFGGLIFGFFYIRQNINNMASLRKKAGENQEDAATAMSLKLKDTDKDGISDYDEVYLYNTSPYLEDTDSDGDWDKNEIVSGEDPNCPKGKSCLETPLSSSSGQTGAFQTTLPQEPSSDALQNPLENLSMDEVRGLLKNAGVDEDVLNKISDDELKALLEETRAEMQATQ